MRLTTILTTTSLAYQAAALWVARTPEPVVGLGFGDLARPTQPSEVNDYQVWAPEPTQPPSKAIVDLLLHRRVKTDPESASSANNTWVNDHTCGWYSGTASKAYSCDGALTCATEDDVVACATDGVEGFFTACLDYVAVKSGRCESVGVHTGCCQDANLPACGTLVWPGATVKSMFKCFTSATLVSMLDRPQYIIDSSISAASASSVSSVKSVSSASSASAAAASKSSAEAASRSKNRPSTVIATSTAADGSTSTYTSVTEGDSSTSATTGAGASAGAGSGNGGDSDGPSTNTGAVAGGIIGGVSLLALIIAFLIWYVMRKKDKKFSFSFCGGKRKTNKETNVHNKTYNNEKSITKNDHRAYDKSSYSKEANMYDRRSRSVTPNQDFHFHIEDDRYDTTPETRSPAPVQPLPPVFVTKPSKREQRRAARHQRLKQQPQQQRERDLEMEELEQAREQQDYQTHRYHPSSGQRYQDARRTPSPPSLPQPPAPNLDFIGRGI